MNVVKLGSGHSEIGMNCQDATGQSEDLKVVCDGCSEGKHSEVGAKLFCHLLIKKYEKMKILGKTHFNIEAMIHSVMDMLVTMIGNDPETIKNYLSFTILVVYENIIYYCGDGYFITQENDKIQIRKLSDGEYPKYLAYNYISKDRMKEYGNGVEIQCLPYNKYMDKVGIASDGIRFVADRSDDDPLKQEFIDILLSGRDMKMKLFFNRNASIFKDDFSIVF